MAMSFTTKSLRHQARRGGRLAREQEVAIIHGTEGTSMSIEPQLRITLLLGFLSTIAGCGTTDVSRKPNWDERVPPKAATHEDGTRPTPAPRETPVRDGGGTPALALSSAKGRPGAVVSITAKLTTGGANIAGTQNDIVFDPKSVTIAPNAKGRP